MCLLGVVNLRRTDPCRVVFVPSMPAYVCVCCQTQAAEEEEEEEEDEKPAARGLFSFGSKKVSSLDDEVGGQRGATAVTQHHTL